MTKPGVINLSVRQVSKQYRIYPTKRDRLFEVLDPRGNEYHAKFDALKDISFELRAGETLGIIGKNGSGKSTLLKIITGVLTASSGSIEVSGQISALLELGAGFNPDLTGRDNIFLNGAVMGVTKEVMQKRLDSIIEFADIGPFIDQPVRMYSSGMFVRLAFAVAINVDPQILIVDEALSVGDMAFQRKCVSRMKELISNGRTVIFVSHDLGILKSLCQRVIWLHKGQLLMDGPAGKVVDKYVARQLAEQGDFLAPGSENQRDRSKSEIANVEKVDFFADDHETSLVNFGARIRIRLAVRVAQNIENLVVAFYVKDRADVEIAGTNTSLEKIPLQSLKPGLMTVEFEFENRLRDGSYSIQILLSNGLDNSKYFDWWDDAIIFRSVTPAGEDQRWCVWSPPIKSNVSFQE